MNKEPIGLYILRFFLAVGLLAFMCMLYWSSTLIENDMKALRIEVGQLKNEVTCIRNGTIFPLRPVQTTLHHQPTHSDTSVATSTSKFPNLLEPDPFMLDVLPKMLGQDFTPHGTFHDANIAKPDNLHPFSGWAYIQNWIRLCGASVAQPQFGKYGTLAPDLAIRMEERPTLDGEFVEFWVYLRDGVYWQPLKQDFFSNNITLAPQFLEKNQVTAEDFKFCFDAIKNPYVQGMQAMTMRPLYELLEEVRVIDKLTFVARWKTDTVKEANGKEVKKVKYVARQLTGQLTPLPAFVYKYFANGQKIVLQDEAEDTYRSNSVWAENFANHWAKNVIVSCGAWVFDGLNERQIKFRRNADFYSQDEALALFREVDFKESTDTIWQSFKNGDLDTCNLQPEQLMEFEAFLQTPAYEKQVAKGLAIKRLDYLARMYFYIGWNQATPFFQSTKVRQAMTMAIDRSRLIEQNLNGLGIETTGTFHRNSPAYDPSITPWPFSPQQARRFLEEEGWYDSDGDGIIDKLIDGKRVPFRFSLTYYVKNPTTKSICEYVSKALKAINIDCRLKAVDVADLSATFEDKSFEALCLGWTLGNPPEDPRQLWHSAGAKEKGSSNAVSFVNKDVDSIIDQLDYESNQEKRIELYHKFDAILHHEQPYTFLYSPNIVLLYREYLENVFIPAKRQDLIPGANVGEPNSSIYWINKN